MSENLTGSFNEVAAREVAALHVAFPQELKNMILLFPTTEDPIVYVADEISELVRHNSKAAAEMIQDTACYLNTTKANGAAYMGYDYVGASVKLITLSERLIFKFHSAEEKMASIFALDHELGHQVVPNGMSHTEADRHLAECAADAFAALRHIHRYRGEANFLENKGMASHIIFGISPIHYTEHVIQKIIDLARERDDIITLSLEETAQLAGEIALHYHESNEVLAKVSCAFQPLIDCFARLNRTWNEMLPLVCIDVMRQHLNDPDIVFAGQQYLLWGPVRGFIQDKAPQDPAWQDALDFVGGLNKVKVVHNPTPKKGIAQRIKGLFHCK